MNYYVAAATDIGLTKKTNQDSYIAKVYSGLNGKIVFAAVCDGMGGLAKGELASATVVKSLGMWADNRLPDLYSRGINENDLKEEFTQLIEILNEKIKNYGQIAGINLGTTLTAILLTDSRYYVVNVGDSRIYEITNNIRLITKDQTVVAREVELGYITEEQAKTDPRRSVLLQCIGSSEKVYPDFFSGNTAQNAVYMLCSDGFRHEITPLEIFRTLSPQVMTNAQNMQLGINNLIDLNKQRSERDNITALTIRTF